MDGVCGAKRLRRGIGIVLLVIQLHWGGVTCYRDDPYNYVSFEDTGEWSQAYSQTCRSKSRDDFREPRYLEFPRQLRPPWESKTPISINTKDVFRKEDDNLTLHIYNNHGVRDGYSVSYGFQRNKECIHGQDKNCIVHETFGSVRALVINAERFTEGQDLNYIKDHFLIEDPEKLVTIINGGSVYERKFYEAVFLGGYPPKALQNRGKSSHMIDGKSYPMEIYMYFMDETVPAMSLATILVVLVEESPRDNQVIKPIVSAVQDKLYDEERRSLHNNELMYRSEREFHNQGPSYKYDIFTNHKKKGEEKLHMERFADSASLEENYINLMETYEKVEARSRCNLMQALGSQLLFLDEDLKKAKKSLDTEKALKLDLTGRSKNTLNDYDYAFAELHFLIYCAYMSAVGKKEIFGQLETFGMTEPPGRLKEVHETYTYDEWFNKTSNDSLHDTLLLKLLRGYAGSYAEYLENPVNVYLLHYVLPQIAPALPGLNETELVRVTKLHESQFFNLTYHVFVHCQKYDNWVTRSRNDTLNKKLTVAEKYRYVKEYSELLVERRLLNEDLYDHYFANDSLHQMTANEWGLSATFPDYLFAVVPDYTKLVDPEGKKRLMMNGIIRLLDAHIKTIDYEKYNNEIVKTIKDLAEANHFEDDDEMRDVIHNHKYGYSKEFNLKERREYLYKANFQGHLPYQEKRRGFVNLANMEMTEEKNKAKRRESPLKVKVNQPFQISWLLPHTGGYYYYAGSSPVPPCYRAQNVIVFKKPITMSRHQIEALTRVPIAFDRKLDIVHTTPVLHDTKFMVKLESPGGGGAQKEVRHEEVVVPVYDQPRNHLFLGHDGVHLNSVLEYEKRKQEKEEARLKSQSGPPSLAVPFGTIWIVIIVAGFA